MSRIIDTNELIDVVANMCKKACFELDDNLVNALKQAYDKEESPYGKSTLELFIKNAEFAKNEQIACCQDTGTTIVVLEIGQEVSFSGISLAEAINEGVRRGYSEGYLRKSIVKDPLDRINTGDNTPCILHTEIVTGDKVHITIMPKGGGSENMGAFTTLLPSDGIEGVTNFVLNVVQSAGGKACPPMVVGVGVGGTMDKCTWLSKKALLRPIGDRNKTSHYAKLEDDLLEKINNLGIGPLGMGGRTTALDVHIEYYPCHITSLPVSVSLQCHANRRVKMII